MSEVELLQRRLERERTARKEAESLLEQKSLEVYEANQQLQDLNDQTNAIVETAAEGIITYDSNGTIRTFNRSAERIFKTTQAIGQDIREHFVDNEVRESTLFPSAKSEESSSESDEDEVDLAEPIELSGLRASQRQFFAEVAISKTLHNEQVTYTALVRDLSRRKKLEARLGQAQKMESVGQLAAGIAHEINTPIQFVGDNIRFLQDAFDDVADLLDVYQELVDAVANGASTASMVQRINDQCEIVDLPFLRKEFPGAIQQSIEGIDRVASIVRAMKEFSQPASENKSSVDINHAIENTLAVSKNLYRDIATVETSLDTSLKPLACLAGQMNQCLLNILTNAFEALAEHGEPNQGRVRIKTQLVNEHVEIRIDDNGPGIAPDVLERIFDPFFTTKEVGKGTGQGLAFVYDVIVNKHEGTIHAQSVPGHGTTFILTLPVVNSPKPNGQAHANSTH